MLGEILMRCRHKFLLLSSTLCLCPFIVFLIVLLHYSLGIGFINLGVVVRCASVDETFALSISCGVGHLLSLVEFLLPLFDLTLGVDSSQPLEEGLLVGLAFLSVFPPLLVLNDVAGEHSLLVYHIVGQLLLLGVKVTHLFSLVHHLESHRVEKVISRLVDFHFLFKV